MFRFSLLVVGLCSCNKQIQIAGDFQPVGTEAYDSGEHHTEAVNNLDAPDDDADDDDADMDGAVDDGSDDGGTDDGGDDGDGDNGDGDDGDGDDGGGDAGSDTTDTSPSDAALLNLDASGPYGQTTSTGTFSSSDGCDMDYQRHTPTERTHDGEAFIFHGFMRGKEQFFDLAEHLASWGITATAVDFCHSTFSDVDTEQNSRDGVEFARSLGASNVVWMGQSNGGLSALIAGGLATDISAGVLGLDPVESMAGGGETWAGLVTSPAAALFGIADSCNSDNSGLAIYRAVADTRSARVNESDHCSFEFPSNFLCTAVCDRPKSTFSDAEVRYTILELTTAWTLGRLEPGFDDGPWWDVTGERYEEFSAIGALSPL